MAFNPYLHISQNKFLTYPNLIDDKTLQNIEKYTKTLPCIENDGFRHKKPKGFRKTSNIGNFPKFFEPFQTLIENLILNANHTWGFNIKNMHHLYAEYTQSESHLAWHNDIGPYPFNTRKISFSINLNNTDEFEGGNLEFNLGEGEVIIAPQNKGSVTIFPSFLLHRVTPITKGIRKVLVGFVEGPPYK